LSAHLDPTRPLSARGRAEVAKLAQLAFDRNVEVAELRHSGILRAQQTAEILAEFLKPRGGVGRAMGLLPDDDPDIARLELDAADQPTMLVGHLPHLNRLAALLAKGHPVGEFGPATMLCFSKNNHGWLLEWQITPGVVEPPTSS
jgi:phosphohistidine phosphatase